MNLNRKLEIKKRMKKMLLGILILLLIIVSVTINSRIMHKKLTELQDGIIESLSLPPVLAEISIKESFENFEKSKSYLALMINESRLDVISDAYFECMKYPDMLISKNKLIYELSQLLKSEKLCIESIF